MNKKARQRLVIATTVLVVAFAVGIAVILWQQSATYLHVGELGATHDGDKVQISGKVEPGSISKDESGIRFVMLEDRQVAEPRPTVAVEYAGAAPDALENPEAFVIVEGVYDDAGRLVVADTLKTKCPSKYKSQAESPAAPTTP